jgi:primosomal protein N' (replication factor Y)
MSLGEQVIYFKIGGYSPLLECMACGPFHCQQCDVSLTYHKHKNQSLPLLRLPIAKPTHCHSCSSVELTTKGFGTEQIQQELTVLFR